MDSKFTTWAYSILPGRGTLIAAALASVLIYQIITTVLAWRRLRHFPGPPLACISNLWMFLAVASGQCHVWIASAQKKYGKIMRIGPDAIMIYDPETIWRINSARTAYVRGEWYENLKFHPDGDSIFSETDTALHDRRKANLTGGFAGKGAVDLEGDVDSQVAALVGFMRAKIRDGQGDRFELSKVIRWFQLDLITLVGLGEAWGDLRDETDHYDFLRSIDVAIPVMDAVATLPFLRRLFFSKLFLYLAAPKVTDKEGLGRSIRETRAAVKAHFDNVAGNKPGRQNGDMLTEWIKRGHSPEECELDLSILMPAGTETTITVIQGLFMHILSSPAVYKKLKEEIADGIGAGRISRPVTNNEAKEMPYLQAVISESMRVVQPVINGFAKAVPPGGDTICGKFVPEGTEVHINVISMLLNTEIFGEDAEVFRPERFLECDEKQKAYMLKTVDLSFGHGRWLCLGKPLAIIELNKIFVELLRVFDFQIARAGQPWRHQGYSATIIDEFELRIWENPLD